MHNAGFGQLGIERGLRAVRSVDAEDFVRFARAVRISGASITAPFKVDLMSHVDEVDRLAERVGAINTLVVRDGRWIGANTDVAWLSGAAGRPHRAEGDARLDSRRGRRRARGRRRSRATKGQP